MIKLRIFILILIAFLVGSCTSDRSVQVIAHRGGAKLAPENTLASFQKAIDLGVDMIEIDIEQTKDSVVVVLHDGTVDRTTNGSGRIDSLTFDYVNNLDAGSWFSQDYSAERIPTLEEVLKLINGHVILLIEIKDGSRTYPGIEKRAVDLVKKYNANSWTIVQSFNKDAIDMVKDLDPSLRTYFLIGGGFNEFYKRMLTEIKNKGSFDFIHEGIGVQHSLINTTNIDSISSAGLRVFVWTVNDRADMDKFIALGVQGIITDAPDVVIEKLKNK